MGFLFSDKAIAKAKKSSKTIPIETARKYGCKVCPLNRTLCQSPKMEADGVENPDIYLLGSGPDATDDEVGKPFAGNIYDSLINAIPKSYGLRFQHVVNCKAPSDKTPKLIELEACRKRIVTDIENSKPKLIFGIGKAALYFALKDQDILNREAPLGVWHNLKIPIKIGNHTCWFIPLHHPKEIIAKRHKNKRTGELKKGEWDAMFLKDIEDSIDFLETNKDPLVIEGGYLDGIEWTEGNMSVKELAKVLDWIKKLSTFKILTLDVETDHIERKNDIDLDIRPYNGDGLILTIALGDDTTVYSFPIDYPGAWSSTQVKIIKAALFDLLYNYKGPKIGHNTAFDLEWSAFYLGKDLLWTKNWKDTQAQACAILNRRGTMSLDVQVFLKYGFWLKSLSNVDKTCMKDSSLKNILPYNGMDTLWTARLYLENVEYLKDFPSLWKVADHMQRTITTLLRGQNRGLLVDKKKRDSFNTSLSKTIARLSNEIVEIPEVQLFRQKLRKEFNPGSPHDVLKILTEFYGLDEELRNQKGKRSTKEDILKKLDLELTDKILELRGVSKKLSTYVQPLYKFIQEDGYIHHQFNQYITSTGRLSSSGAMNVQNFPNLKGKELRGQIIVPEGFILVPSDYGQIEARIIAVASQDVNYLKALWEDYDVHLEWAERIAYAFPAKVGGKRYLKDSAKLHKFRKAVKNKWTFPAFYGSSVYSIAKALGIPIEIMRPLFDEFWDMFSGVKTWQDSVQDFYNENGYVESLTGRRRYGPMTFNEMINDPIQGTASDITVDSMNRLEDAGIVTLMNIHDDVTSLVRIEEMEEQIELIARTMCSVPYPWINCPISIEISAGENWCDVDEVGVYKSTEFIEVDDTLQKLGHYRDYLYAKN